MRAALGLHACLLAVVKTTARAFFDNAEKFAAFDDVRGVAVSSGGLRGETTGRGGGSAGGSRRTGLWKGRGGRVRGRVAADGSADGSRRRRGAGRGARDKHGDATSKAEIPTQQNPGIPTQHGDAQIQSPHKTGDVTLRLDDARIARGLLTADRPWESRLRPGSLLWDRRLKRYRLWYEGCVTKAAGGCESKGAALLCFPRADMSPTNRGPAAAAAWIFRGVAAPPRRPRGYSVGPRPRRGGRVDIPWGRGPAAAAAWTFRGVAAAAAWIFRGDESRRRGRDVDSPTGRRADEGSTRAREEAVDG